MLGASDALLPASQEPAFGLITDGHEMVMPPYSEITATTAVGTITITADRGGRRCFTWEDATGCVTLDPDIDRWMGRFGAGSGGWPPQWHNYKGISRAVIEEGQQHFPDLQGFIKWVTHRGAATPLVYNDNGLVVGWDKSPYRYQLYVEVWQVYLGAKQPTESQPMRSKPDDWPVYVGGEKPTKLPGSQNDKIKFGWVSELPKDMLSRHFIFF
jgi:hypothetical protein